jgi:hypothetical protein
LKIGNGESEKVGNKNLQNTTQKTTDGAKRETQKQGINTVEMVTKEPFFRNDFIQS